MTNRNVGIRLTQAFGRNPRVHRVEFELSINNDDKGGTALMVVAGVNDIHCLSVLHNARIVVCMMLSIGNCNYSIQISGLNDVGVLTTLIGIRQ